MRHNGHLQALLIAHEGDGGATQLNEYGEPVARPEQWGDAIPCLIQTVHDTRLGRYEDGELRQASYVVLVELTHLCADRIRLVRMGESLGEHRVQRLERMPGVGRVKVIV